MLKIEEYIKKYARRKVLVTLTLLTFRSPNPSLQSVKYGSIPNVPFWVPLSNDNRNITACIGRLPFGFPYLMSRIKTSHGTDLLTYNALINTKQEKHIMCSVLETRTN